MTNENYSPDEIRLLDEFANSAMLQGVKSKECAVRLEGLRMSGPPPIIDDATFLAACARPTTHKQLVYRLGVSLTVAKRRCRRLARQGRLGYTLAECVEGLGGRRARQWYAVERRS
jgi:hypothetical protein